MKQTAVEWLLDTLGYNENMEGGVKEIIEKAKEMEKEQIEEAFYDGYYKEELYDSRKYYNETYESNVSIKTELNDALREFQKKYPSVTSGDLQTFILGWQAAQSNPI